MIRKNLLKRSFSKLGLVLLAFITLFMGMVATSQSKVSALDWKQVATYAATQYLKKLITDYNASNYSTPEELMKSFRLLENDFNEFNLKFENFNDNEVEVFLNQKNYAGLNMEISEYSNSFLGTQERANEYQERLKGEINKATEESNTYLNQAKNKAKNYYNYVFGSEPKDNKLENYDYNNTKNKKIELEDIIKYLKSTLDKCEDLKREANKQYKKVEKIQRDVVNKHQNQVLDQVETNSKNEYLNRENAECKKNYEDCKKENAECNKEHLKSKSELINYLKKEDDKCLSRMDKCESENKECESEKKKYELENKKYELENKEYESENKELASENKELASEKEKLALENTQCQEEKKSNIAEYTPALKEGWYRIQNAYSNRFLQADDQKDIIIQGLNYITGGNNQKFQLIHYINAASQFQHSFLVNIYTQKALDTNTGLPDEMIIQSQSFVHGKPGQQLRIVPALGSENPELFNILSYRNSAFDAVSTNFGQQPKLWDRHYGALQQYRLFKCDEPSKE